jgi:hypothetical protein
MRLFIDNMEADLGTAGVSINMSIARLNDFDKSRTGYSKTIRLPRTLRNAAIFGDAEDVNRAASFNDSLHTARIEHEGCTLIEGVAWLASLAGDGYEITLTGPGCRWMKTAGATPLSALPIDFSHAMSAETITESWTWDKPVRFLPVLRTTSDSGSDSSNLLQPLKIMAAEDYHPFIHVRSVVEAIFGMAGYGVESEFMRGELFGSLYMSGAYAGGDSGNLPDKARFRAGRFFASTSTADHLGRVYANPFTETNTVGNIVESADPREQSGGVYASGVFCHDNSVRNIDGRIAFVPSVSVSMAFEFDMNYTTDYYLTDRKELAGFNRIYLGGGQEHRFVLPNRFTDRRDNIRTGKSYTLVIFGHVAGDKYELRYKEHTSNGTVSRTQGFHTTRTATVSFSGGNAVSQPALYVKRAGSATYVAYTADWALYDGYIKERGQTEVRATVRSKAERLSAGVPRFFSDIYFGGGQEGMSFTLGAGTAMRPVFAHAPADGDTLTFSSVAAHKVSCLDIIRSLRQMFNLCFYTDEVSKTVFIEPRAELFGSGGTVDWSDRIDLDRPIRVSDASDGLSRTLTWRYAEGDRAVAAYGSNTGSDLGRWSARLDRPALPESERVYTNPLFAPTAGSIGRIYGAESATLPMTVAEGEGQLNFSPRIVVYAGMRQLREGESWGWPSYGNSYPMTAFHHTEPGFSDIRRSITLCFEDRDGLHGLHRYYDSTIAACALGKRIEAYVRLYPEDVEAIMYPNRLKRDFRALFRLRIGGECALWRLEEICDYDPAKGESTKCVFVKEI